MSYDIRTPMNAIIGLTHLARDEEDLQVVREYLHNIDTSSTFLLGLINDILDMSKIENGELTLREGSFTKQEFEDSINTVIRPQMEEKEIHFVFRLSDQSTCIWVDRLRFSQIFSICYPMRQSLHRPAARWNSCQNPWNRVMRR